MFSPSLFQQCRFKERKKKILLDIIKKIRAKCKQPLALIIIDDLVWIYHFGNEAKVVNMGYGVGIIKFNLLKLVVSIN